MLTPTDGADAPATADLPGEPGEWVFDLSATGRRTAWHRVGRLYLSTDPIATDGLVYDPILNHPAGAVPGPAWLRKVREAAYRGSRAGRGSAKP
ncbi:hypothetical protein [Kribbella sp. CA-293567]|uniref:hypothetical protein n=1 Tax=Kribbella sp. CA-293567 TaxID=3002436 RepID=UPI0022DDF996|nr:hypothetical protein [Kribbella sp. CA-293567]WBQ03481.1 hypothetical protein OX958_26340 [Kribbella sp. CA-293567]